MNFEQLLAGVPVWDEVKILGRTLPGEVCLLGLTARKGQIKLHLLAPAPAPLSRLRGPRNQRWMKKYQDDRVSPYLNCGSIRIGGQELPIGGGSARGLQSDDRNGMGLLYAMKAAGWQMPQWLAGRTLESMQLVSLKITGWETLPEVKPELPVVLRHRPDFRRQLVEQPVTLRVGKSRTLTFVHGSGQPVRAYIQNVRLIDVWKETEESLNDPQRTKDIPPRELEHIRRQVYSSLSRACPQGYCYPALEYECEGDLRLEFCTKAFLRGKGDASGLGMIFRTSGETGPHGLPLRNFVLQGAVPPDTQVIPAELFSYEVPLPAWEEAALEVEP